MSLMLVHLICVSFSQKYINNSTYIKKRSDGIRTWGAELLWGVNDLFYLLSSYIFCDDDDGWRG